MKIEIKYETTDLNPQELTEKLHLDALRFSPVGNTSIIGVTASVDMINVYLMRHVDGEFNADLFRS